MLNVGAWREEREGGGGNGGRKCDDAGWMEKG